MSEARADAFAAVPSLHFFEGASRLARLLWADGVNAGAAAGDAAAGKGSPDDAETSVAESSCGVERGGGVGDCDVWGCEGVVDDSLCAGEGTGGG
jgi:hypothetical protein